MPAKPDRWLLKTVVFLGVVELLLVGLDLLLNYSAWVQDEELQELFNVAREPSLGNWFSSVQELAAGVTLWLVHLKVKKEPGARLRAAGWAVLAVAFCYVAVDDGARVHERVGVAVSDFYTDESAASDTEGDSWLGRALDVFPSYPWQVLFGPPFAAMGIFLLVFLWRELPDRRLKWLVVLGLALYAMAQAQDFVEGLETPYDLLTERYDLHPYTVPHLAKIVEEYLEMLGTTVLLYVFLEHLSRFTAWRSEEQPAQILPTK